MEISQRQPADRPKTWTGNLVVLIALPFFVSLTVFGWLLPLGIAVEHAALYAACRFVAGWTTLLLVGFGMRRESLKASMVESITFRVALAIVGILPELGVPLLVISLMLKPINHLFARDVAPEPVASFVRCSDAPNFDSPSPWDWRQGDEFIPRNGGHPTQW